jgi:Tol biopolymer transport system component
MQVRTTSPQASTLATWLVAVLGAGLLVVLLLSFILEGKSSNSGTAAGSTASRVAYFEFGANTDTLWTADATSPSSRTRLLSIDHASDYGVIPSISPDGTSFAYTALPPTTAAPKTSSPAGLWVAGLGAKAAPKLLAQNADLLVKPIWSADGSSLVYRRTDGQNSVLVIRPVDGGEERVLGYSSTSALFPVGFTDKGDSLYYIDLNQETGSRLFSVALDSGVSTYVASLSLGLTRDWALSPGGKQLAYLEIALNDNGVASRAYVLDLAQGTPEALTDGSSAAFGPVWNRSGELVVGTLNEAQGSASLLVVDQTARRIIAGSGRGFEVPISIAPDGSGYVVRSFENASATSPGRSSLTLVGADGSRRTIATGEVTFVGWTNP